MEDIVEPSISHDFSTLCLGTPTTVSGGSYFTRIMHKNNKPLYVQTPKCFSKQGFVKSGKRIYADLMFDNNDTIFIDWIERLEAKCQELVYIKGDKWFQTRLEKDDIETAFTSPLKVYKSGKFYLLRVNVKPNIKIYNESDKVVNLEEIVETNSLISILEIQGIKFTSRNFQIEIDLKQSLVVSPDPFLDTCFIKKPTRPANSNTNATNALTPNSRILDILKSESDVPENEVVDLDEPPTLETHTLVTPTLEIVLEKEEVKEKEIVKEEEVLKKEEIKQVIPKKEEIKENESFLNELSLSLEEFDFDEDFDAKTAANTAANSSSKANTLVENDKNNLSEAISLDITELDEVPFVNNSLEEIAIPLTDTNDLEMLTLKKPNQVYHEIYQKAREKAKAAKKEAMLAYLEVKNIKKTYMLDNMDDSDSDLESEY